MTSQKKLKEAIVNHWGEAAKDDIFVEDTHTCFACGRVNGYTEICHLIPKSLGGQKTVDNLVLLCQHCHTLAPDVSDKDYMLSWVANKNHYVSELFLKIQEAVKDIPEEMIIQMNEWLEKNKKEQKTFLMDNTSTHKFAISESTAGYAIEQLVRNASIGVL